MIDRVCGTDSLVPGTYYVKVHEKGDDQEIASYVLSLSVSPCVSPIVNGDFELGQFVGWDETSEPIVWDLVVPSTTLTGTPPTTPQIDPHSGEWAVWLGGDENNNLTTIIYQTIEVPLVENQLQFWYWIQADINCGDAYFYVLIDLDIVWSQEICWPNNMSDWAMILEPIDLMDYAGQTVTLEFRAITVGDPSPEINPINQIFIDDVDLVP
jgi:hypothetical protein